MLDAIIGINAALEPVFVTAFLVFLRIGAAMSLLPGFGEQSVPMRIKLGLALAFTALVLPLVSPLGPGSWSEIEMDYFLMEPLIGLAIGLFFRLFIIVLQLAGVMAAQATSLSQIFGGGATPDPMPAFGNALVIGGIALTMSAGLHVQYVYALASTYGFLPFGVFPDPNDLTAWGVTGITRAFALAFQLAMPFLIASTIYNLALGAINRAMPQLMVAFVGAPAITFGGLALLFLTAPVILLIWQSVFEKVLQNPAGGF